MKHAVEQQVEKTMLIKHKKLNNTLRSWIQRGGGAGVWGCMHTQKAHFAILRELSEVYSGQ